MAKIVQSTAQLHSFNRLAKYCSKFSKLGFKSMWTESFQVYKLGLKNAEEPEIKLPTTTGSLKKQPEGSRKMSTSASLTTLKPLNVCITTNCGKFLKR